MKSSFCAVIFLLLFLYSGPFLQSQGYVFNQLYDYNMQLETVEGILELEDGYFMLLRTTDGPLTSRKLIVHRLDKAGNSLWEKVHFADSTAFYPTRSNDIEPTDDGGFIVGGRIWQGEEDDQDAAIVKFTDNGDIEWIKEYGSVNWESAVSFQKTPDGGYIMGGGSDHLDAEGDFYLVKTDESGEMEWEAYLGGLGYQSGTSVDFTPDGGYVISGRAGDPPFDVDIAVAKCDSLGSLLWYKIYGGEYNNDAPHKVLSLEDGNILISGGMGNENFSYSKNRDAYLIKIDQEGEVIWENVYDEEYTTVHASNIVEVPDGSIVVAGIRYPNSSNAHNSTLSKFNENGELIWRRIYINPNPQVDTYFFGLSPASDGGFLAYGFAYDPDFDNFQEGWLIKTDSEGYTCEEVNCVIVDVEDAPLEQINHLDVFPNPTTGILNIRWQGESNTQLGIYALDGTLVWAGQTSNNTQQIDISAMPAGMYFIQARNNSGLWQQKIIRQ
jgi:hypothetical protein